MTDTEIIKALECCVRQKNSCNGCPAHTMNCTPRVAMAFALDLINRQKVEIERLKSKKELYFDRWQESLDFAKEDRAEAIKEFAERLKVEKYPWKQDHLYSTKLIIDDIDNLVKEMTEDTYNG